MDRRGLHTQLQYNSQPSVRFIRLFSTHAHFFRLHHHLLCLHQIVMFVLSCGRKRYVLGLRKEFAVKVKSMKPSIKLLMLNLLTCSNQIRPKFSHTHTSEYVKLNILDISNRFNPILKLKTFKQRYVLFQFWSSLYSRMTRVFI